LPGTPGKTAMKRIVLLLWLGTLLPISAPAGEPGFSAHFVGGTVPGVSPGSHFRIDLTSPEALMLRYQKVEFRIDYRKVQAVEYGQNVNRRYVEAILISPLLLLAKSRKHYVTVEYLDEAGHQQALVFRVGKGDIRSVLASLEARTGRRVEYQDNEARKSGR
jgi:hypothetical protein